MAIGRILHRGAAEGAAVAGERATRSSTGRPRTTTPRDVADLVARPRRRTTAGCATSSRRCAPAPASSELLRRDRHRPVVPRPDRAAQRGRRGGRATPPSWTATCCAGPSGTASPTPRSASCAACPRTSSAASATRCGSGRSSRPSTPAPRSSPPLTPYHYSSYDEETEVAPREEPAVVILGSGPNRIGQGIEFDYSCVHASFALRERGLRDRDGQLQPRDRLDRLRHLRPALLRAAHARGRPRGRARRAGRPGRSLGVIVQLGGQTPLGLAQGSRTPASRSSAPAPRPSIWPRTAAPSAEVLADAGLIAPKHGTATSYDGARRIAAEIGYPVLVRPSYVLGGRGMEIVYDDEQLATYMARGHRGEPRPPGAGRPVPRRRDRDRRRRALRRRGALPRWRDGAHRGGRHPLR